MARSGRATDEAEGDSVPPRYSIVMPTFQRCEVVTASVAELAAQRYANGFEVIVVVDGSTDGTADALRHMNVPFPLRVVEQTNRGAARARNHGAGIARGVVLLFLDDDMRADPDLLAAHDAAYARGADAVVGHVPLDPGSPRTFLALGVGEWADQRAQRLHETESLDVGDLLTGQLSIRSELFRSLGGFDENFTKNGSFGREDTDFGRRLLGGGHRLVFAPDAVSRQHYVVRPAAYLRQWHHIGEADVAFLRKHPDQVDAVWRSRRPNKTWNRFVWRPLVHVPLASRVVAAGARAAVVALSDRRPEDPRMRRWFFRVRDLEYWRGVREAGGLPAPRPLRVLCYHSLADLAGAPVLEQYGVPASQLRRQLRTLRAAGFRFVTVDEVLRFLDGEGGLPRKAVLVTFDDCYVDLLERGVPVLRDLQVPAVAFAVTGLTGGTSSWDEHLGAPTLSLLDVAGLRALEAAGIEVGVHGRTHRSLTGMCPDELDRETSGAVEDLCGMQVSRPRVLSYPYGEHDDAARRAAAAAGIRAAFTVRPGLVRPGTPDRYRLPRIEVLRSDGSGLRFRAKVTVAKRLPRRARKLVRHLSARVATVIR